MRGCGMQLQHINKQGNTDRAGYFFGSIMKTFSAKAHEVTREWYVIDATDKVLGRVASEVARSTTVTRVTRAVFMKQPLARCKNASRAVRSRKL